METAYAQERQPLLAPEALAPAHFGTLPLAPLQHPSLQLCALALALLLALQSTHPAAACWSALAVALLSAFFAVTTHAAGGGGGRRVGGRHGRGGMPRGARDPPSAAGGAQRPGALASVALESAVAIAAASWLAVWQWAEPPGQEFWLRWMPTLVLGLLAAELLLASLVGFPPARALLTDKSPPLLLAMDLPARPVAGSPASPTWLSRLAREVTLAWGVCAALAAASCAVPAALGRHAFGGGGGSQPDALDAAMSVCVPFALGLAALALGDALCERARRELLPRMMAVVSASERAQRPPPQPPLQQEEEGGAAAAATAPPSGGAAGLV